MKMSSQVLLYCHFSRLQPSIDGFLFFGWELMYVGKTCNQDMGTHGEKHAVVKCVCC